MSNKSKAEEMEQAAVDNNVDKIREILFGGQMKDYEGRFKRLEEKLVQESTRLTKELENKFAAMEQSLRNEIERKDQQLQQEKNDRLAGLNSMDDSLQALNAALSNRLDELDADSQKSLSNARQEFQDEISILQTNLREQQESLLRSLEEESNYLRNDKVSRNAMAGMFNELSLRLNGEQAN